MRLLPLPAEQFLAACSLGLHAARGFEFDFFLVVGFCRELRLLQQQQQQGARHCDSLLMHLRTMPSQQKARKKIAECWQVG